MTDSDKMILTVLKEKGPLTPFQLGLELGRRGYAEDKGCNALSHKMIEFSEKNLVVADGETKDEFTGRTVKLWRLTRLDDTSFLGLVQRDLEMCGDVEAGFE